MMVFASQLDHNSYNADEMGIAIIADDEIQFVDHVEVTRFFVEKKDPKTGLEEEEMRCKSAELMPKITFFLEDKKILCMNADEFDILVPFP